MSAIIIDTETTSVEAPEVIELAYAGPLPTPRTAISDGVQLQFKPSKPISLGAMATHHIIDEDLVDCEPWPGSWSVPDSIQYIVGHNVDFDWKAIGSPPHVKRICTLALSRSVFPTLDSHTLGAMIYHLYPQNMARKLVRGAHSALTDIDLCARLLFSLTEVLKPRDWSHLWEQSEKARVPTVFSFGKFKGTPISDVRRMDPGYIRWCLSGKCDIVNDDPYWQKALKA